MLVWRGLDWLVAHVKQVIEILRHDEAGNSTLRCGLGFEMLLLDTLLFRNWDSIRFLVVIWSGLRG